LATSMFDSGAEPQGGFQFPESLADKHKPRRVADFLVAFPRNVMVNFARNPKPDAFYFLGGSGLGKTEMALALANELPAQLHHIASKDCDLARVQRLKLSCGYIPHDMFNPERRCKLHVVLVDEAHVMTENAVLAFLTLLDPAGRPPNTVFIFTGNSKPIDPHGAFMSRVKLLPFAKEGLDAEFEALLRAIWRAEGGTDQNAPNFANIIRYSGNNIRDAINTLEVELMALPQEVLA
jgi:replication-associated recombination protein RarA